jgi:hypothetical protein
MSSLCIETGHINQTKGPSLSVFHLFHFHTRVSTESGAPMKTASPLTSLWYLVNVSDEDYSGSNEVHTIQIPEVPNSAESRCRMLHFSLMKTDLLLTLHSSSDKHIFMPYKRMPGTNLTHPSLDPNCYSKLFIIDLTLDTQFCL